MQCTHTKSDGSQCRAHAIENSPFCWFHDPDGSNSRRLANSLGGKTYTAGIYAPLPPVKPEYYRDTTDLLMETLNQLRAGEINTRTAVAMAHIYKLLREWLYIDSDYRNGSGFLLQQIAKRERERRQQNDEQDEQEQDQEENQYQEDEQDEYQDQDEDQDED